MSSSADPDDFVYQEILNKPTFTISMPHRMGQQQQKLTYYNNVERVFRLTDITAHGAGKGERVDREVPGRPGPQNRDGQGWVGIDVARLRDMTITKLTISLSGRFQ